MVSETAVVGYPHDVKGEGIFAFVVLKDKGKKADTAVIEKELRALCKTQIAGYAVPDYILVNTVFPTTLENEMFCKKIN